MKKFCTCASLRLETRAKATYLVLPRCREKGLMENLNAMLVFIQSGLLPCSELAQVISCTRRLSTQSSVLLLVATTIQLSKYIDLRFQKLVHRGFISNVSSWISNTRVCQCCLAISRQPGKKCPENRVAYLSLQFSREVTQLVLRGHYVLHDLTPYSRLDGSRVQLETSQHEHPFERIADVHVPCNADFSDRLVTSVCQIIEDCMPAAKKARYASLWCN